MKLHRSWQQNRISEAFYSAEGHCYLHCTQTYSNWLYISSCIYSSLPLSLFNRACLRKDHHRRVSLWLHMVAYVACNNWVTTIQNHRIHIQDMPLAQTVNLGYTPINIFRHIGRVTLLHSSHFSRSTVLSPVSKQHDTKFPTNQQYKQRICKL